jgi:hypothetical protein
MASTGLGADEAPMDRYPVDGIKEKTPCELHQSMKNISMKMAIGYASSCEPRVTWHFCEIPVGYARVGVDEIVPGYESLELDMPGPEDETTLGEVKGGVILWNKKDIKFLGLAPPPPPLSRRRSPSPLSPPSPPRDYDHHIMSHLGLRRRVSRLHRRLCPLSLRAKSGSLPPPVLNNKEPDRSPSQEYRRLLPIDLTTILWRTMRRS